MVSLPSTRLEHRQEQPGLVRRHHAHAYKGFLYLVGHHGLVQPESAAALPLSKPATKATALKTGNNHSGYNPLKLSSFLPLRRATLWPILAPERTLSLSRWPDDRSGKKQHFFDS